MPHNHPLEFLKSLIIHVCAALKHQFIDKDNVLRRMLTGRY